MSLHKRKKRLRWGAPETVGLVVLLLGALPAILWGRSLLEPEWTAARVEVVECEVLQRPYQTTPDEVRIAYRYQAGGREMSGDWRGIWPQAHSPNALPHGELARICEGAAALTVHYNPARPEQHALHHRRPRASMALRYLAAGGLVIVLAYLFVLYPRWRRG